MTLQKLVVQAANLLKDTQYLCVLTGAGISVESGIPDFRSPGGLWSKFDPFEYAHISNFYSHPEKYWMMAKELRKTLKEAVPNPAHIAVVELGKIFNTKIVTQNIDYLHQIAGSQNVIELHGTYRTSTCMECSTSFDWSVVEEILETEIPPLCTQCGTGVLKSDTVLFGEPLPSEAINTALRVAHECDAMLVIGSSLIVYPAASLPIIAIENRTRVIIVNLHPTYVDNFVDVVLHEKAGTVLPLIVSELKKLRSI